MENVEKRIKNYRKQISNDLHISEEEAANVINDTTLWLRDVHHKTQEFIELNALDIVPEEKIIEFLTSETIRQRCRDAICTAIMHVCYSTMSKSTRLKILEFLQKRGEEESH